MSLREKGIALPFGLLRLLDMINFNVGGLAGLCFGLRHECTIIRQMAYGRAGSQPFGPDSVEDELRDRLRKMLKLAQLTADEFEWEAVSNRIVRFHSNLNDPNLNYYELNIEAQALKDAIEDGLKWQIVYRYPSEKAKSLKSWKSDWSTVITMFPNSAQDIRAGVDLWCLGHGTASVFHMMRVLEYGLAGFANNVGKSFHTQSWHGIIDEIESAITKEQQKKKSKEKELRLQFLSEAAKELRYFKDGWRNYVSHNKCVYDEDQAKSVINHTRDFMTTLAAHLSEQDAAISNQERDQIHDQPNLHPVPERSQ